MGREAELGEADIGPALGLGEVLALEVSSGCVAGGLGATSSGWGVGSPVTAGVSSLVGVGSPGAVACSAGFSDEAAGLGSAFGVGFSDGVAEGSSAFGVDFSEGVAAGDSSA